MNSPMKHFLIITLATAISGCASTPLDHQKDEQDMASTHCENALRNNIAAIKASRVDLADMKRLAKSSPTPENNENVLAAQAALSANEAAYAVTAVDAGCPSQIPSL